MSTIYRAACDCGFTGSYRSEALAARALRVHSCDKHRAKNEARARGERRSAAADRTPKPCVHLLAQHEHGSHAAYVLDRCRCSPCRDANAAYERNRSRQNAYGRWTPHVPAAPVREHVRGLMAAGIGLKQIARLSGIAHSTLGKLVYGARLDDGTHRPPSGKVKPATAQALLAVTATPESYSDGARVDATGTRRRLQTLVAAGWSQSRLASELGVLPSNFGGLLGRDGCQASTARQVRALYGRLAFTPPPQTSRSEQGSVTHSRRYAAERGWPPPMWWDDDDLDNPTFVVTFTGWQAASKDDVDDVAVLRACRGERLNLTVAERREVVRRLHAERMNDQQISARTGLADRTVLRIRQELGLAALIGAVAA